MVDRLSSRRGPTAALGLVTLSVSPCHTVGLQHGLLPPGEACFEFVATLDVADDRYHELTCGRLVRELSQFRFAHEVDLARVGHPRQFETRLFGIVPLGAEVHFFGSPPTLVSGVKLFDVHRFAPTGRHSDRHRWPHAKCLEALKRRIHTS